MPRSAWKISAPIRSASANDGAPTGITMNSWKSTLESACAPPFRMFIIGTGSDERRRCRRARRGAGRAAAAAQPASARSAAIDTPSSALAPSRLLVGVPSSAIIAVVERALIELAADERLGDLAVDVGDRLADALADVARLVAVAQLQRLALAGRRARRHRRPPEGAAVERDVDFDRRVAARVQNLAAVHACDFHSLAL